VPLAVTSGPLSATFPTLAKTFSYATGLQLFLSNFLLGNTKNAYNQRRFSKCYLQNNKRTKAKADNEAIHGAFRNGWL